MSLHPSQIVGAMSEAKFAEMMARSPRSVRETLFGRLNIKASSTKSILPKLHQKNEERIKKLHTKLAQVPGNAKNEQDLCSELIRNWLVGKNPMLIAAMDQLGVKHENGLTEQELDFIEKLEPAKVKDLVGALAGKFADEEVGIYLRFMKVPHLRGQLPAGCYPKDAPAALTDDPETVAAEEAPAAP
ncbi:MAG: hypothetical protein HY904_12280 [Deltaproteobacteria bacterium]|nr:hypothetical protein [Deltaproteobacteria bacterium]